MSTTISGNVNDLTGAAVTSNCYVRFWLRGCNGNQPRVGGAALIAPDNGPVYFQDFVPNASGQISGTLYSNDVNVSAGGQVGVTWYGVQIFFQGIGGAETPYALADGVAFNLNVATPINTTPVVAAPTGDSTYIRLDGGNSPVTGALTFNSAITAKAGVVTGKLSNMYIVDGVEFTTIPSAILAAKTAGGGEVYIPSGTYSVASPIFLPSNITLRGAGSKKTILNTSGTVGFDIFTNVAQITNIALTSNVVTVTCANAFAAGDSVKFGLVATNTFLNGQTVTVSTASATQFTAAFTHANVVSVADSGVAALVASNIIIRDIYLNATSISSGTSRTCYLRNVTGFKIQNNEWFNSESFACFIDDGCSKGWIQDNSFDTVQVGTCILVGNGPLNAAVTDITISNNYCANTVAANGIFVIGSTVAATPGTARITITGNRLFHCADTGIEVGDSCTDVAVTGNVVQMSLAGETGILVRSCQNVTIAGNVVRADTTGANQLGIYVWNNSGDNVPFKNITICGNTVQGLSGTTSSGIAWSSNVATSDGLTIIGNTSINNTLNFDPRTTNITNLTRYANSDGIFDTVKQLVAQKSAAPAWWLKDTGQAITTGGLWRHGSSGGNYQIDMNQAAGGDFSALFTAVQIDNTGNVIIPQNKLIVSGLGDFQVRAGLKGSWFSDAGATLKAQIDGTTGKMLNYGGITTAGLGLGAIYGSTSQRSETAADANVLTLTPAAVVGSYRLRFVLSVSAATAATLGWTATWTDSNAAAQTPTNLALYQSGVAAPALTFTTSAAGNYYGEAYIDTNAAAANIVIKLTFAGTSFTAKASATIERLI